MRTSPGQHGKTWCVPSLDRGRVGITRFRNSPKGWEGERLRGVSMRSCMSEHVLKHERCTHRCWSLVTEGAGGKDEQAWETRTLREAGVGGWRSIGTQQWPVQQSVCSLMHRPCPQLPPLQCCSLYAIVMLAH